VLRVHLTNGIRQTVPHIKLITLHGKKYTLPLLHLALYNLYASPVVLETEENLKNSPEIILTIPKTILQQ